jgi:nitrogen fixation NifU-like protein
MADGVVRDVGFEGAGCAISTASASLMTEAVKGRTAAEVHTLFEHVHHLLTDDDPDPALPAQVGKLAVLAGVRQYPMRVKCATLAWHVLDSALKDEQRAVCTE